MPDDYWDRLFGGDSSVPLDPYENADPLEMFNDSLDDSRSAPADYSGVYLSDDLIVIGDSDSRTDLEYDESGRRTPRKTTYEKALDDILKTPGNALLGGLAAMAIIFFFTGKG